MVHPEKKGRKRAKTLAHVKLPSVAWREGLSRQVGSASLLQPDNRELEPALLFSQLELRGKINLWPQFPPL